MSIAIEDLSGLFDPLPPLEEMRILVSNDDGIHAPGLKVLERVAQSLCPDVWVVAPEVEQSGAAHSLTIHRPLRIREQSERRYAVDGTPTDAVLLAVNNILKDRKPSLVISGVNRGSNLGEDVTYSGTVAAAMEGTLLGIPAIAFSQSFFDTSPVKWATAEHWAPEIIRRLVTRTWPRNVLMNVNFPDVIHGSVTGVKMARLGKRKVGDSVEQRLDPRGRPYIWIGPQKEDRDGISPGDSDIDLHVVEAGAVAITPLCLDLTHLPTMTSLQRLFP